jgi:hypothetical protein
VRERDRKINIVRERMV